MCKLALNDELLMKLDKPSRYIGGEVNMVKKNPKDVDIRFAMCFPDVYEIGMSHLGIQILYDMFNKRDDTYCERVYSPWPDLDKEMRENNIPLFALESQEPIKDFDFLGVTLQYEMCYTNVLQILDLAQIPLYSKDRTENDPIVTGGGPCTYNAEPIADFFDIFYIGEGETRYAELLDLYKEHKKNGYDRKEFLYEASKIPGMYVPSLYDVSYNDDGTIKEIKPNREGVPEKVKKEVVKDFDAVDYPTKPLVPYMQVTQDRCVLEIQRGCIRGCRFCQAGSVYKPLREKNVETLKKHAVEMLDSTGQGEISLASLSSSDYSQLKELVDFLMEECAKRHVNISLPSLRIDAFSLDVMSKIQDLKKNSVTFAPEAGSQRMRDVINKGLTKEEILKGCETAFKGGWKKVKLYFMLGQPFETDEDAEAIMDLCEDIAMLYYDTVPKEDRMGRCQVNASSSFFVPKPFTPFQWCPQNTLDVIKEKMFYLKDKGAFLKNVKINIHNYKLSQIEAFLTRGDKRLNNFIYDLYKTGSYLESWDENLDFGKYNEIAKKNNLDIETLASSQYDVEQELPWDFIECIDKEYLKKGFLKAKSLS